LLIVHKGGGARSCSCSCREAQKGGAKGRRKARGAGPMVVFYSDSSISLQLVAHLGTFVLLALERFFRLALMVLDFGRVINLT
jgi:hypothetical protein